MLHSGFRFGETQEQAQVNEGPDSLLGCGSIGSLPRMEEGSPWFDPSSVDTVRHLIESSLGSEPLNSRLSFILLHSRYLTR